MINVSNEYLMTPFTETVQNQKSRDIFTPTKNATTWTPDTSASLTLCGYGPKPTRQYAGQGTMSQFRSYYTYFRGMNGCLRPGVRKSLGNGPRYVDSRNSQIIYENCLASNVPFELKMFNPATNDYELVKLCYENEYQRVEPDTQTPWLDMRRISPFWMRSDGTWKYIYESSHFNLDGGSTYDPKQGYYLTYSTDMYYETPIYFFSTDIAWDVLNSQWVGQLYLYMRYNLKNYSGNSTWSNDFVPLFDGSNGLSSGPFNRADWNSGAWANASPNMKALYSRAFLLDSQPSVDILNTTMTLNKCKCVGPNTIVSAT